MGDIRPDEDDDFITSVSSEPERDEADAAFDAKEKKKKRSHIINLWIEIKKKITYNKPYNSCYLCVCIYICSS